MLKQKRNDHVLCMPVFTHGSGLGNRLFPWARCKIFSHQSEIPMVMPIWGHFRTGPLRKGGVDVAHYCRKILLWDTFICGPDEIKGLSRLSALVLRKKKREPDDVSYLSRDVIYDIAAFLGSEHELMILFKGDYDQFRSFYPWREFIFEQLKACTLQKWIDVSEKYPEVPIAINLRRGKDFPDIKTAEDCYRGPMRTPLRWFVESLQVIRKHLGYSAQAYVVTEGNKGELKELLSLGYVTLVNSKSPMSDLLILSKAKILIASGGSSFSAWASFFGQMPTISHPGQSLTWFKLESNGNQYVGEFDPAVPSPIFLDQVRKELRVKNQ